MTTGLILRDFRLARLSLLGLAIIFLPNVGFGEQVTIKSGVNEKTYTIEVREGTAGTAGEDYILGEYFGGGNENINHGFNDKYAHHQGYCPEGNAGCYISTPSEESGYGALEATDHNWLQCTKTPIIADLGGSNDSERVIVFTSIDHLGIEDSKSEDPKVKKWNVIVEAVEFTVYGSDDFPDVLETSRTPDVFGNRNTEGGAVPSEGIGSTFEQGQLELVFAKGWKDSGNEQESDDYASVWKFPRSYRFIAVYANYTDPLIGDGFQSRDCEVDAIGAYYGP